MAQVSTMWANFSKILSIIQYLRKICGFEPKEKKDLWEQEELFWKARSRLQWLKGGDKNSKYFHATTIQRRARNRVSQLRDGNGVWVEEEGEL